MAESALSAKHKRFVAEYLTDLNATQAYIRAGYSEKGADVSASRLLGNASVRAAIEAGQAKLAGKLEITAETVLKNLEAARSLAMGEGQCSAAIRACELQGKHIGMFVERTESDVTVRDAIDRPPAETREQWIARRRQELNGATMGAPQGRAD